MDRTPKSGLVNSSQRTNLARFVVLLFVSIIILPGCGGGGGGGPPSPVYEPVVYTGITAQATITEDNANDIFAAFMGEGSANLPVASATAKNETPTSLHFDSILSTGKWIHKRANMTIPVIGSDHVVIAAAVNETTEGSVSGTMTISGDIASDGTGTLTFTYKNYNDGDGDTTDGKLTFRVLAYDQFHDVITNGVMDIVLLRVKSNGSDLSMSGTMAIKANIASHTETMTMDIDGRDNNTAQTIRFDNFTIITVYENLLVEPEKTISESMSGRVFLDTEGYVDVTTESPLLCLNCTEFIPATGGPVSIVGNNSRARLTPHSIHRLRIEVDADNDSVFESINVYKWDALNGAPVPNTPPTANNAVISPDPAYTDNNLTASIDSATDSDGDKLYLSYIWDNNDTVITGENTANLTAQHFSKDDVITVNVTISDGVDSIVRQASITIQNSAPTLGELNITPAAAYTTDLLTAQLASSNDIDQDSLTFTYAWMKNDTVISGETSDTLAASHFIKNDTIQVSVAVSDGSETVTATSLPIIILDSSPVVSASPPASILYSQELNFTVTASDADDDPLSYSILYGPVGMQVDEFGQVTWTPSMPMFDEQLEIHFVVRVTAAGVSIDETGSISITDPGRKRPLVRSGLGIPGPPDGIVVADFDGNGTNEMLVTDGVQLLYTLVYNGTDYIQDWVYPFVLAPGESITSIAAHDFTGDGNPDMIVGAGSRIVFIDGVSRRIVAEIVDGFPIHRYIQVADVDHDDQLEIVFLAANEEFAAQRTIYVYDFSELSLEWRSATLDYIDDLTLGNVDQDPALELITANGFNGYVFDGATHMEEWRYDSAFGSRVDTGDVDGDGVEELFGLDSMAGVVSIYSVVQRSLLGEITLDIGTSENASALLVADIDDDPQPEVIVGKGGDPWNHMTYVMAYDSDQHNQQWNLSAPSQFVTSLVVGDADSDGIVEVLWTSHVAFSGHNGSIVVAGLTPTVNIEWINDDPMQLDGPFIGGHWLTTTVGKKQAIFASVHTTVSPTNPGGGGMRVVAVDPVQEEMSMSSDLGLNNRAALDGADYDNDGIGEIFIVRRISPFQFDGNFTVYDFEADQVEWSSNFVIGGGAHDDPHVTHGDLNGDGHEDFISLTPDRVIHAYDVWNNTQLWQSEQLPGFYGDPGHDIEVVDLDNEGVMEIIAASKDAITVLERQFDGIYTADRSISVLDVNNILIQDLDGDNTPEIVAVASYVDDMGIKHTGAIYVYNGLDLSVKGLYITDHIVDDLATVPLGTGTGNMLIAIIEDGLTYILEVNLFAGAEIWRSPPLMGNVQPNSMSLADTNNNGYFELLIGTSAAMYVTR